MTKTSWRLIFPGLEHLLHSFADLFFSAVALRGVEQAKSCFERGLGCVSGCDGVGNECAEAEGGHRARAIIECNLCVPKVVGT
jgi:hypothetical protein